MNILSTALPMFADVFSKTHKPSTLDQLFRFSQHESLAVSERVHWQVSAGSLEKKKRLYRVFYRTAEVPTPLLDLEVTMHVKKTQELEPFFRSLLEIVERSDLDEDFRRTCQQLLILDPWLGYLWAAEAADRV